MWRRFACLFGAALLLLIPTFVGACGDNGDVQGSGPSVVATTTQIGDFSRVVGGGRIRLTVLLVANQDAHTFAPKPSQIREISRAALILRNGVGLDSYVNKSIASASGTAKVVVVTQGITLREAEGEEGGDEALEEAAGHDPHVWFSVPNAKIMVERTVRSRSSTKASGKATTAVCLLAMKTPSARLTGILGRLGRLGISARSITRMIGAASAALTPVSIRCFCSEPWSLRAVSMSRLSMS